MNKITKIQKITKKISLASTSLASAALIFGAASPVFADAATLSATASASSVQINKTFTVRISVSADEPVSTVTACLTYDTSKVTFVSESYGSWLTKALDGITCGSAHEITGYTSAGSPPSSGTVATVTFRAKVSSGSTNFGITSNSFVGAKDNGADIYTGSSGDSINFTAPPTTPPPSGGGGGGGSTPKPDEDKPAEEEDKTEEEKDQEESKPDETATDDEQVIPVGGTDDSTGQSIGTGTGTETAAEEKGLLSKLMPFLLIGGAVLALAGAGFAVYKFVLPRFFNKAPAVSSAVTGGAVVGGATPPPSAVPPQSQQPTVVAPSAGAQPTASPSPSVGPTNQPPKIQ